jgi:hypothetical protein
MHPALIEGLASQHAEELRATAAPRHHKTAPAAAAPARPGESRPSIAQRAGWALIQVGLWLAVRPHGRRACSSARRRVA